MADEHNESIAFAIDLIAEAQSNCVYNTLEAAADVTAALVVLTGEMWTMHQTPQGYVVFRRLGHTDRPQ